jgi:hypothetical protein
MKTNWATTVLALSIAGAGLGMATPGAASAQDGAAIQALADRIAIEDMMVTYYAHLGGRGGGEDFSAYYTDDGVFEVNGAVYRGREAIAGLYGGMRGGGSGEEPQEEPQGMSHMVLSNAVIDVDGDAATASFIWTGFANDEPTAPPRVTEQGREYDLLVRVDGGWRIKKRTIIADGGAPEGMMNTWERKPDYDIRAEE